MCCGSASRVVLCCCCRGVCVCVCVVCVDAISVSDRPLTTKLWGQLGFNTPQSESQLELGFRYSFPRKGLGYGMATFSISKVGGSDTAIAPYVYGRGRELVCICKILSSYLCEFSS